MLPQGPGGGGEQVGPTLQPPSEQTATAHPGYEHGSSVSHGAPGAGIEEGHVPASNPGGMQHAALHPQARSTISPLQGISSRHVPPAAPHGLALASIGMRGGGGTGDASGTGSVGTGAAASGREGAGLIGAATSEPASELGVSSGDARRPPHAKKGATKMKGASLAALRISSCVPAERGNCCGFGDRSRGPMVGTITRSLRASTGVGRDACGIRPTRESRAALGAALGRVPADLVALSSPLIAIAVACLTIAHGLNERDWDAEAGSDVAHER